MADFAKPPMCREQLVLFPEKLDQIIPPNHFVRLLDDILQRVDWSKWVEVYHLQRGQPPIHPRVLASVILYGLLRRVRSSRALEEALVERNSFRWLAEGRTIDHTTLCKFRQKNSAALKDLFVQIGMIAREMGFLRLVTLAYDGTRMRAKNRRSGTQTPSELEDAWEELAALYAELEAQIAQNDQADQERLGDENELLLNEKLADVKRRQEQIKAAMAEIERIKAEGKKLPKRLPVTDAESRVTPNKDGGFAPNYTPLATVDVDSGLIVSADVIPHTDEDKHLIAAIEDVQSTFGLTTPPEVLTDGLNGTGENLAACEAKGIDLYSPHNLGSQGNPAARENPTEPVPAEQLDALPTTTTKHKDGTQTTKFHKDAFHYDGENNRYLCPQGKTLNYIGTTSEMDGGRHRIRYRYHASTSDCQGCPLASRCLGKSKRRTVTHEQHESHRVAHARKMASPEAKAKYARRSHAAEFPFAMIKHVFGVRSFSTIGLKKVRTEWLWLVTGFNLHRLLSLMHSGPGPPAALQSS